MPNPFDQFDAHASDGNPFDRFDAAAPRIESHARDGIESTAPAHLPAAAAPAPPDTRTEVGALDSYTRGTRAALHRTMGLGGMLGMPVASAADAIHAALSGHTETGAQDYWASHAIDPNYHAAQQLDIHPDTERQGFGGKVAGGVGALLPDLLAMLATGGEAPAAGGIVKPIVERSLAREVGDGISHAVGHAADASIVPGASHGASEAVQTVDNGGSILDALGHVPNDYLKAVAQNTLPLAAGARPGAGLLERVLTKGAQGAAAMPVVTAGMNQLEGHPTDAGDLGVQAVLGALMAQMGGDAPHDFKATDPVVDPNQRPAPVVEPRQGGEPVAGPDHVDLTTLPEQVAMQARADAAPPVVVHNAKPITPERRTQLEWMRDHGSPVERSTAEILLKANPAEPAQEPAGATPAPTAPTPAPEARVEAPVAPPAPAVEPAQPALADVLKMPENDYIAAVNPEGKTQSPDDHVILHTGDLPPTEAPKVAEFAAKDGTPVAVHRDDHGNLQAVVDGNVIATVDGHDGETSLNVVTEHQGNGVGKGLMKEYLRDNPLAPSGGFSAGGEATRRAAFRELQAESKAPDGHPAPEKAPAVASPLDVRGEIGWDQVGGRLLREADTGGLKPEVTGRTNWVAKMAQDGASESDLWRHRPDRHLTEKMAHEALDKFERGEPLKPIEQRFIDHAQRTAQEYADADHANMAELDAYDKTSQADELQALRDEHAIHIADADGAEALSLYDLIRRNVHAGVPIEAMDQPAHESDAAYAARLWKLHNEATTHDTHPEAAAGDQAGSDPGRADGHDQAPAETRQTAPGQLFPAPTAREQVAAAVEAADAKRNGLGRDLVTPAQGAGELLAGDAPVQAHVEDAPTAATRNLKRWFGQSSVTDTWESGGEPRRLFHATRADFDSFKVGGDGTDALGAESGPVIFMTDNPERQNAAHNIGGFGGEFKDGARVMPLYARIENPLHVDEFNMEKLRAELGLSRGFPSLFTSADVAALKAAGHDGVIHFRSDYDGESTNEVIAFDKSQVKSATANSGAFDPSSGSLTDPLPAAAPPADVPPTSIKNEVTEAEADRDGVEAAASSGQPAWKDAWEKARADAARQPDAGRRLTADLIAHPRPIDTHETAALLHDRVRIHNELADARAATKDTAGKSDKQQGQDVARLLDLEQQRHDNDVASRQSGSENAAALNARKMMAASDYTLETVLQRAEVARGEKLPPEVTKRLEDMAATIADLHKRIEAKQAADKAAKAPKEKAPKKSVDEAMQEKIRKDIAALEARIKQRLSACPV